MRTRYMYLVISCLIISEQALSQVELEASANISNKYVWRGFKPSDSAVLQPALIAGFGSSGISLSVWSNLAVQDRSIHKINNELDFTLRYDKEFTKDPQFRLSGGIIQYTFPWRSFGSKHSEEIFLGVGRNWMITNNTNLNPNLTFYYDFRRFEAFYSEIGITPNFTLNPEGTLYLEFDISAGLSNYDLSISNSDNELKFNIFSLQLLLSREYDRGALWIQIGYNLSNDKINPDKNDFLIGAGINLKMY